MRLNALKTLLKRLGNAEPLRVQLAQAGIIAKADGIVTAMKLHDIYNGYGNQPGGVLGVIDHVGVAGQDNVKLHRMLPQQARKVLTSAGFVVEAESALFANPADDHTLGVFVPGVRGKTDQFMIRACKPRCGPDQEALGTL